MKKKIFDALKTKYADKGLSEKALDGVASFLEKTVQDESGIDAAVSEASVAALLSVFQSEIDSERGKASKTTHEFEEYKKAHPESTDPAKKEDNNELVELLKQMKADNDAIKAELKANKDAARKESVVAALRSRLESAQCNAKAVLDLTMKGIEVGAEDTADSLFEKAKTDYQNHYNTFYGDGVIAPTGGFFGKIGQSDEKDEFSGVVSRLRSSGVLKAEEKK